jgi:septal ring factor EnvC (AmiA/AmiB activator)
MVNKPATRKDIDDILKVVKGIAQQTSDEFVSVNERFNKIDERFNKIDERFNKFEFQVNSRFDKIETNIIDLQKSHDRLLCTIDRFLARIDTYETEQIARDSQFKKLLDWARKVSAKTGIPLENL